MMWSDKARQASRQAIEANKDQWRQAMSEAGKHRHPNKGFGANRERARAAGRLGGSISRRTK